MKKCLDASVLVLAFLLTWCGEEKDKDGAQEGAECEVGVEEDGCDTGLVCEETKGGVPKCAAPITIKGQVVDTADGVGIAGAWVQALDPNGASVGSSAVTDAAGNYELTVPAVRDVEGVPVDTAYTLRAQAADYQRFPSGLRQALPLDASRAVAAGEGWVIENALSTIGLISMPGDTSSLGTISGTIQSEPCQGVLVIAEQGASGYPGYSNSACEFTIFNVPAGTYEVRGYLAGVQLTPSNVDVTAGQGSTGVSLVSSQGALGTVIGNIQFVNASSLNTTSVILAVESTFIESVAKGEAPFGLRAGGVTGDFTIQGVPDGKYVVLASFENDGLVRDPDESIGGTVLLRVEMPAADGTKSISLEGFKVTGALSVVGPGTETPEAVATSTPTFEWEDDSSEDGYRITVFDAFGEEILADEIEGVSGSSTVTYTYGGPAFEPGMYYQFKVSSFREKNAGDRTYISSTEDLRGVFYYTP